MKYDNITAQGVKISTDPNPRILYAFAVHKILYPLI